MPLVGAVAAPHSHLQLFTRPAENENYQANVAKGRKALGVLREQVEKSGADTMLSFTMIISSILIFAAIRPSVC